MQELIAQLLRLYFPVGAKPSEALAQHVGGQATHAFDLVQDGAVRTIVIPFEGDGAVQWDRLCEVANVLQAELRLPAPAVSVSGATGYRLWLSFEQPVPVAQAQQFLDLLHAAWFPEAILPAQGVQAPVELPPNLNPASGKWAAFIHPGMGASFADEPALEMAPPAAGQAGFLHALQGISPEQLQHALAKLQPVLPMQPVPQTQAVPLTKSAPLKQSAPGPQAAPASPDLLLKDATLEDIVRHLHALNIEPTFRHLLPKS